MTQPWSCFAIYSTTHGAALKSRCRHFFGSARILERRFVLSRRRIRFQVRSHSHLFWCSPETHGELTYMANRQQMERVSQGSLRLSRPWAVATRKAIWFTWWNSSRIPFSVVQIQSFFTCPELGTALYTVCPVPNRYMGKKGW